MAVKAVARVIQTGFQAQQMLEGVAHGSREAFAALEQVSPRIAQATRIYADLDEKQRRGVALSVEQTERYRLLGESLRNLATAAAPMHQQIVDLGRQRQARLTELGGGPKAGDEDRQYQDLREREMALQRRFETLGRGLEGAKPRFRYDRVTERLIPRDVEEAAAPMRVPAPTAPPPTPEGAPQAPQAHPLTTDQQRQLKNLGYFDAEIARMRADEAARALKGETVHVPPDREVVTPLEPEPSRRRPLREAPLPQAPGPPPAVLPVPRPAVEAAPRPAVETTTAPESPRPAGTPPPRERPMAPAPGPPPPASGPPPMPAWPPAPPAAAQRSASIPEAEPDYYAEIGEMKRGRLQKERQRLERFVSTRIGEQGPLTDAETMEAFAQLEAVRAEQARRSEEGADQTERQIRVKKFSLLTDRELSQEWQHQVNLLAEQQERIRRTERQYGELDDVKRGHLEQLREERVETLGNIAAIERTARSERGLTPRGGELVPIDSEGGGGGFQGGVGGAGATGLIAGMALRRVGITTGLLGLATLVAYKAYAAAQETFSAQVQQLTETLPTTVMAGGGPSEPYARQLLAAKRAARLGIFRPLDYSRAAREFGRGTAIDFQLTQAPELALLTGQNLEEATTAVAALSRLSARRDPDLATRILREYEASNIAERVVPRPEPIRPEVVTPVPGTPAARTEATRQPTTAVVAEAAQSESWLRHVARSIFFPGEEPPRPHPPEPFGARRQSLFASVAASAEAALAASLPQPPTPQPGAPRPRGAAPQRTQYLTPDFTAAALRYGEGITSPWARPDSAYLLAQMREATLAGPMTGVDAHGPGGVDLAQARAEAVARFTGGAVEQGGAIGDITFWATRRRLQADSDLQKRVAKALNVEVGELMTPTGTYAAAQAAPTLAAKGVPEIGQAINRGVATAFPDPAMRQLALLGANGGNGLEAIFASRSEQVDRILGAKPLPMERQQREEIDTRVRRLRQTGAAEDIFQGAGIRKEVTGIDATALQGAGATITATMNDVREGVYRLVNELTGMPDRIDATLREYLDRDVTGSPGSGGGAKGGQPGQ